MCKFITTTEISSLIERIIKDSEDFIILATPFIQIHSRLKVIIERKLNKSDVQLNFICRNSLPNDEDIWLRKYDKRINVIFNDQLHAKCYLNEKAAIVTSLNLYHYSIVNNIEFGVFFERKADYKNYCSILEEIISLGLTNRNFFAKNHDDKIISILKL